MDALSRMNKAPFTLPSWDQVNILRDPPRSIHTRKKERVEAGDITHNIREMKDRTSDNILRFARGQNPMVSVSYSNHGTNSSGVEASNPYKVVRDGAFRPPMLRPVEDLQPLSRRKFERPARQTAKGVNVANFQFKNLSEQTIDKEVLKGSIAPRTTRNIAGQAIETYVGNSILDPLQYSAVSKVSSRLSSQNNERGSLSENGYLKDRDNISTYTNKRLTANTQNNIDKNIAQKTRDYIWSSVGTAKSVPLYTKNNQGYAIDPDALKLKVESKNASTNRRGQYSRKVDINGDNVPELVRSLPSASTTTNKRVNAGSRTMNRDVGELETNRPTVYSKANRRMLSGAADHERTNATASNVERKQRPRYGSYHDRVVIGAKGIRYNDIPDLPNKDPRKGSKLQQPPYTIENEPNSTRNGYGPLW